MAIESMQEVVIKRRQRSRLSRYWAIMGYIFQLIRDIDPKLRIVIDTFTLLGFIYSTRVVLSLLTTTLSGFRIHLWSRVWKLNLAKRYGKWALITGATDGIGLEYAREFARRGLSLILVGRSESKLQQVKTELSQLTQVFCNFLSPFLNKCFLGLNHCG